MICTESGEIRMKDSSSKVFNIEKYLKKQDTGETKSAESNDKDIEKYYKREYFLPIYDMLTAVSSQNLQHEGVQIEALNGQRLYCRKGVG